jgi:predicted nucleic acid-binding protein
LVPVPTPFDGEDGIDMPVNFDRRRATVVAFDALLELELWRAHGLQSYDAVHAATLLTSGVTDMVTRDAGFAVLMPEDATLHTTRRRLSRTRARRRDACGS